MPSVLVLAEVVADSTESLPTELNLRCTATDMALLDIDDEDQAHTCWSYRDIASWSCPIDQELHITVVRPPHMPPTPRIRPTTPLPQAAHLANASCEVGHCIHVVKCIIVGDGCHRRPPPPLAHNPSFVSYPSTPPSWHVFFCVLSVHARYTTLFCPPPCTSTAHPCGHDPLRVPHQGG